MSGWAHAPSLGQFFSTSIKTPICSNLPHRWVWKKHLTKMIIRPSRRSSLYWCYPAFILHFNRWHRNEPKLSLFKLHRVRRREAQSKTPFTNLSNVIIKWSAVAQNGGRAWFMSVSNWTKKRVTSKPETRPIRQKITSDASGVKELFLSITSYYRLCNY